MGWEESIGEGPFDVEVVHWIRSQPGRCGCHSRDLIGRWWMRMARVWILGESVVIWTVVGVDAETEAMKGDMGEGTR